MAGQVTITEETLGVIKKIKFEWTSDAEGDADGTTSKAYNGVIERLVTIPGTGDKQPTDNYDVAVLDADGLDVLFGSGADRSNTDPEQVNRDNLGAMANDKLKLKVSNAGNAKSGTVILYIR